MYHVSTLSKATYSTLISSQLLVVVCVVLYITDYKTISALSIFAAFTCMLATLISTIHCGIHNIFTIKRGYEHLWGSVVFDTSKLDASDRLLSNRI